jgi:hypothetical protein
MGSRDAAYAAASIISPMVKFFTTPRIGSP